MMIFSIAAVDVYNGPIKPNVFLLEMSTYIQENDNYNFFYILTVSLVQSDTALLHFILCQVRALEQVNADSR